MALHASYKSSLLGMHFKTLCLFEENLFIYLGKKQQSGVSTHMICHFLGGISLIKIFSMPI